MISSLTSWWDDVNESDTWQQTIFYVLCAAYSIVGTVAFVSNYSFLIFHFGDIHIVFFHKNHLDVSVYIFFDIRIAFFHSGLVVLSLLLYSYCIIL